MHTTQSERALIFAPNGRDARLAASMLREGDIESDTSADMASFVESLQSGVGLAVIAEEAFLNVDLKPVVETLEQQEQWSDLPFILLTNQGGGLERNPRAQRYLQVLRNVTFLERPFHPTTFVSLARAALRSRQRQYDARARITEIADREMELRDALNAGALGQWTLHLADMRLDTTPACKAIYGRTEDESFTWDDFLDGIDREDRPNVDAAIAASLVEEQNYEIAFRFHRPNGEVRWVQAQGRPLFDNSQHVSRATGVVRDITAQKEADERLRESERQFRTLADSIPTLCWVAHADGSIYWYNSRWYEYTGTTEASMQGWGWQSVHDPEILPTVVERWSHSIATGEPFEMVFPIKSASGTYSPFLTRVVPVRSSDGTVVGWFGTNTDITVQQEAEKALRNIADDLERRVEERTRKQLETAAQLHEAQKIETIGQLTGGIAHDFNNLLTPVIGTLDLLSRRENDERTQRLIAGAQEASERSRTLISRLLSFARRQKLEARPVDVGKLVEGMVDLIQRSLGPRVEIDLKLEPDVPFAMVDPNQLELALLNLAVNARDAMTDGGTLTIAVMVDPADPGLVALSVKDDGSGMDDETVARAIEPFYSTKETGKGTGLGLSMVHGLAAQSGGRLDIASEVGVGTTVTLHFPSAPDDAIDEPVAAGVVAERILPRRILLVDDNDLVRRSTAELLRAEEHDVAEADSGEKGLRMLDAHDFDVVISDYLMPGMTGEEFLERAKSKNADLVLLLISGYAEGIRNSEFALLSKPFRPDELNSALRAVTLRSTSACGLR
ncbi:PAS domain S-box protein [Sphingomicrobium sp. XHP0239]|uniref:hybrid sensor histidine kinase/response regulator n=1 Tax=Sphingomicrobium maritimum TaxID=3133972 RepID=UPI0031CCC473